MATREEGEELVKLYDSNRQELLLLLSNQLSVLKSQAQMLLGLCGLAITVTGFSGHNMVRAGPVATGFMIGGISVIFVAILLTLRALSGIRWVTQDLGPDLSRTVSIVLGRRDEQQRALERAARAVALGLGAYTVAVILAALRGGWTPP
jgi:hypothetical protein